MTTNRWLVLVLVCFAQFMVVLDATVTNVALPSIQNDLGFSEDNLQWVVNSYTLVFGGFLLLGGRAGDLVGRKRIFLAGLTVFTVASLLNGLATSQEWLIISRGLQGLGGAMVSPAALSIITTTFSDGAERTKALAVWGGIAAGGAAVGLLLGGVLTELFSWEWIFLVNVPIGIAVFVAAMRWVPESRAEPRPTSFDLAGAVSVTAGLVVLVYAIVEAAQAGWASAQTLVLVGVAVLLLGAFVAIELRSREPLVRLGIFRVRTLSVANGTFLVVAGGLFAMFFFASIYQQRVLGYSPIEAGIAFLPVTVGIGVGSVIAQQMIARIGPKWVAVGGMTMATIGLVLLAGVPVDGSYVANLLPGLLLMAFGMGLTFVPLTLIATTNVSSAEAGLASGVFNTSQQVGGALGLAVLSSLATTKSSSVIDALGGSPTQGQQLQALVDGFQVAFIAGAVLIGVGMLMMALLIRQRDVAHLATAEQAVPVAA